MDEQSCVTNGKKDGFKEVCNCVATTPNQEYETGFKKGVDGSESG